MQFAKPIKLTFRSHKTVLSASSAFYLCGSRCESWAIAQIENCLYPCIDVVSRKRDNGTREKLIPQVFTSDSRLRVHPVATKTSSDKCTRSSFQAWSREKMGSVNAEADRVGSRAKALDSRSEEKEGREEGERERERQRKRENFCCNTCVWRVTNKPKSNNDTASGVGGSRM